MPQTTSAPHRLAHLPALALIPLLALLALAAGCATPPGGAGGSPAVVGGAGAPPAIGGPGAEPPSLPSPEPAAPPAASATPSSPSLDTSWLPFFGAFTEPDGTHRTTAAGPFYESATFPDNTTLSAPLRPFYVSALRPDPDYRHDWASLWPLASGKTLRRDRTIRILNYWHYDRDIANPTSAVHNIFFPFWFSGRARDGRTYHALFPIGGTIGDFLVKERIEFLLFPLWARSYVNDVTTTDILWPILSRTTTPDNHIDKFRIFPFYSRNHNAGHYDKTTILWPFWSHATYHYPASSGTSWVLFPICGRTSLSDQSGWSLLPPLIQHTVATNGDFRTVAPWPFYIHKRAGSRETLHIWPLYGQRSDGHLFRQYFLWPILTRERNAYSTTRYRRWTLAPFVSYAAYSRAPLPAPKVPIGGLPRSAATASATNAPPPDPFADPDAETLVSRRIKLWPLFTHQTRREPLPATRFAALDLWPGPTPDVVERSWAPFWTLFDYRTAASAPDSPPDAASLSLLWGLYRQSHAPDAPTQYELFPLWRHVRAPDDADRHWSLLKGLLAYDRTPSSRRLRLLYLIPIPLPAPQ